MEAAADGAALWPVRKIARIACGGTTPEVRTVDVEALVDNLTWTPDGRLLCAGQITTPSHMVEEFHKPVSDVPIAVIEIHPDTLQVETLIRGQAPEGWGMASVALQVGDEIWPGSPRANGILRFAIEA